MNLTKSNIKEFKTEKLLSILINIEVKCAHDGGKISKSNNKIRDWILDELVFRFDLDKELLLNELL